MEKCILALETELPTLPSFDRYEIDEAVRLGLVGRSPASLYKPEGDVFWSRDFHSELGLALLAERCVRDNCSNGKSEFVGTVNNLIRVDGVPLDRTIATAALVYGRDLGLMEEHDIGGVSVFVLNDQYRGIVRPMAKN
ncbi:MAG: hypothetical protein HYT71_03420 [Candidatus Aenigmarchaeota archaeon]|nr:hypothetical protein [Candidatus Aenigmarchaeota archaeon]